MKQIYSSVRGFSLTEFAIVLGVIGIVLGLVWTAATTTWEMARREQAGESLATVVNNVRSYYSGQLGIPFVNAGVPNLVPQLFGEGVIPNSMQRGQSGTCTNANNLCADTPWGGSTGAGVDPHGTFQVCAWNYGNAQAVCNTASQLLAASQFFGIQFGGLSQENCIKLAPQISGFSTLPGLMLVVINGNGVTPTASPATANTDCLAGKVNTLVFVYRLKISAG